MDLTAFADAVGSSGPVTIAGSGSRGGPVPDASVVHSPAGIEWIQADEMTVRCGAGTPVDELAAALGEVGQRAVLPLGGTVGGALAVGRSGIRRLGDGPLRDALLQCHYVGSNGVVVKAGGPTVKNVSGFDLCRLLVGSCGTLGFLGDVILRTRPIAAASVWFTVPAADGATAERVLAALHRPVAVLWDGKVVHALLEGHAADVAQQAAAAGLEPADAPSVPTGARRLVAPAEVSGLGERLGAGSFLAELGLGVVHLVDPSALPGSTEAPGVRAISRRLKERFDPDGRLNPGLDPGDPSGRRGG
jgi:glycolate oxidase FAD binding subunit